MSETIFYLDSLDVICNVINFDLNENEIIIIAILKLKYYMLTFNLSLDEMLKHCENGINMFSKEFELTSDLRKVFNKEFSNIKNLIDEYSYSNFLLNLNFKQDFNGIYDKFFNSLPSLIHMSMNRHFNENQRFNEFKIYYLTKCYLNQLKFQKPKAV